MTPEEHDALILAVDHIRVMNERHNGCDIPCRVSLLEKKYDRVETVAFLILAMVTLGRLWDAREFISWLISNI